MKQFLATTALVLSLAAAPAFAAPGDAAARHEGGKARIEAALSQLPAEKASLVKDFMEKQKAAGKARHEQIRTLRKDMRELLVAREFDKNAYLAKSRQLQQLQAESQTARAAGLADVASKLTQEERMILADAMKPHKRGPGKGKPEAPAPVTE